MTLDKLTTPFERRRVIEYGSDGNAVSKTEYDFALYLVEQKEAQ